MPWRETHVDDQRLRFISDWQSGSWNMSTLCRFYSISRKTGYLWVGRYTDEGVGGLVSRSSAPQTHPQQVSDEVEQRLLLLRHRYPHWGPLKLKAWLEQNEPLDEGKWPAASTIGSLLDRHGLTKHRRVRRKSVPSGQPLSHCLEPNGVWSIDFKGCFRMGDGLLCYPLTISDNNTRYLLRAQALHQTGCSVVQPLMVATFREFGLPEAIRSDNGPPFASTGLWGLSQLSVWWILLGIRPERIEPGQPQQNGRHERMHRTMKAEATIPAESNLRKQQRRLDNFRREYNEERPHAALGQVPPASRYEASPRPYPARLKEPEYDAGQLVRRVRQNGEIRWKGGLHYVSQALSGQNIALEERGENEWILWFGFMPLALGAIQKEKVLWKPFKENIH